MLEQTEKLREHLLSADDPAPQPCNLREIRLDPGAAAYCALISRGDHCFSAHQSHREELTLTGIDVQASRQRDFLD
jgi:hypothetical protein